MTGIFFLWTLLLAQSLGPPIEANQSILILFNDSITIDYASAHWLQSNELPCLNNESVTTFNTPVESNIVLSCANGMYGADCNTSSNICEITQPCQNGGTCSLDGTRTVGYQCQCPYGFSGDDCQSDDRICTNNTCWNNGTCMVTNQTWFSSDSTTFQCDCVVGYDGAHCESFSDMCANVTCENYGVCQSTYLNWYCQCIDSSMYSGTYCEETSSSLKVQKALSLSFALVAILAICAVALFVVVMDVLKYIFKIDPVDRELLQVEKEKEKKEPKRHRTKAPPKKPPMKLFYIHTYV